MALAPKHFHRGALLTGNVTLGRLATTRRFAGIWLGKWCAPRVEGVERQSLEGKDLLQISEIEMEVKST